MTLRLDALVRLTHALARATTIAEVCEATFDALHQLLGVTRASVLLFDSSCVMRFAASRGISPEYRAAVEGHSPWHPDAVDPAPICIADVQTDDSLGPYRQIVLHEAIRGLAFFPLVHRARVIGKFMLYSNEPRQFSEEELQGGSLCGAQIAFCIGRLRAEAELRESEERYRNISEQVSRERARIDNLLSSVPGVVWEAYGQPDIPTQRINYVSRYVETMVGYTVEEWLSTPNFWLQIVHPEDRDRAAAVAAKNWAAGTQHVNEFRWVARDGRVLEVEGHAVVIRNEEGEPIGMRGVTMDVTDRKQAEEAVQFLLKVSDALASSSLDLEQTLTTLLDLSVPICGDWAVIDLEDEDGQVHRMAVSHFDPSKSELCRELRRYAPSPSDAGVASAYRQGKVSVFQNSDERMLRSVVRDDRHLELIRGLGYGSTVVAPLETHGRIFGAITFVRAGHNRFGAVEVHLIELLARRAAAAIDNARMYRQAKLANQAKDEFLATLSHELRTPMTPILGWARLLRLGELDAATVQTAAESIEESTRAQTRLIDDLLDISRIVAGKIEVRSEACDLAAILRRSAETVVGALRAKSVEFRLDVSTDPVLVWGDSARLQQIFWNILSNAAKFTHEGFVSLTLQCSDHQAFVAVSDSGEGIPDELISFVFDRFRQGSTGTARTHGGLGLGLAIARSLAELHGGTIAVASGGRGKGSSFTVTLPLLARVPIRAAKIDAPPDLAGIRVLVIEDDESACLMLSRVLAQFGAVVDIARSSAEALDRVRDVLPDVIVSAIVRLGDDERDLLKKIRGVGSSLHSIALTAHALPEEEARLREAGYEVFLSKPVDPLELAASVARLHHSR